MLALLALTAGCTGGGTPAPSGPATAPETAPQAVTVTAGPPPPPGRTGDPVAGISTLPPVPVAQPADFGNGLTAAVKEIKEIPKLEANGPGEIAGHGVGVVVEVRNGTDAPVDLNGVAVNASYAGAKPAGDSAAPPSAPLAGRLAAGEAREGTYVFQVPEPDWRSTQVEINWSGSPNVILVRS